MKINEYFSISEVPQEIDALSTHTSIREVYITSLNRIIIDKDEINLAGEAEFNLELQFGSDSDVRNDIGAITNVSIPFSFDAIILPDFEIDDISITIDNSFIYDE